jgi:hypothetical protein
MDLVEARASHPHRHPWELARAERILGLIRPAGGRPCYADIGSGDLYLAERLARLPNAGVYAVDPALTGAATVTGVQVFRDVAQLPEGSVDVALLMDVLEHVDDEGPLLRGTVKALRAPGLLLVTVPAHASLWSGHDRFLHHRRRYRRSQLVGVLTEGGLRVERSFYFFAVPLAARAVEVGMDRLGVRRPADRRGVGAWPYPDTHLVTRSLRRMLTWDFAINERLSAAGLPTVGLSICAICTPRSA